jgi:hypothetical protein
MATIETCSDSLMKVTDNRVNQYFVSNIEFGEFIQQSRPQWVLMGKPWQLNLAVEL